MATKIITLPNGTTKTVEVKDRAPKINNKELLSNSGLQIVHVRGFATTGRAMTVAYERIGRKHLRISTAVCHTSDAFERKVGTKIALENFAKGNTVILPLGKETGKNIPSQIRSMFGYIY